MSSILAKRLTFFSFFLLLLFCLLDCDFLFVAENVCLNADSQVCCSSTSPERTLSNSLFIALQFKQFVKVISSFAPSQNLARRVYGCFEVFLEIFFKLFKGCFNSFYTQQVLPDSSRVMWFGYMIFPKEKSILRKDLKLQILFARRAESRKLANLPRREAETL